MKSIKKKVTFKETPEIRYYELTKEEREYKRAYLKWNSWCCEDGIVACLCGMVFVGLLIWE